LSLKAHLLVSELALSDTSGAEAEEKRSKSSYDSSRAMHREDFQSGLKLENRGSPPKGGNGFRAISLKYWGCSLYKGERSALPR